MIMAWIAIYADFQERGLVGRRFNHIFTSMAGRRNMKDPLVTGRPSSVCGPSFQAIYLWNMAPPYAG